MSVDPDLDYDTIGFVRASQYRQAALKSLAQGPAIPSEIAEAHDLRMSHISRALTTLRDEDLVELLVSEDRPRGRYYGLTQEGKKAHDGLQQLQEATR